MMRPVRHAFACLMAASVLLAAGLPVVAARAASAWLAPMTLSEEGLSSLEPQVAVDGRGDTIAVWRGDGIDASSRLAGGSWQTPVVLSEAVEPNTLGPYRAQVAMDGRGDAVAVWLFPSPYSVEYQKYFVQAAVRPAHGSWGQAQTISQEGAGTPRVAIDAQGDVIVVWSLFDGSNNIVQAASRPADGGWQAPMTLSEAGGNAWAPEIAFDSQGDARASWDLDGIAQVAFRPANGAWQAPVDLFDKYGPTVVFDAAGDATAVWTLFSPEGSTGVAIWAAYMPAGGTWGAPVDLAEAENERQVVENRSLAIDPQGDVVIAWERRLGGGESVVQGALKPAGGGVWQAPVDLSADGQSASEPRVALDPRGDAIAVWDSRNLDGEQYSVQAASRPAGGTWEAPVVLSEAGLSSLEAAVAYDPQGDAVAVWRGSSGPTSHLIVQAAAYDASGPLLKDLSIPAAGVVGQSLGFSVSPLDVWSGLGVTQWSFGDGNSASGPSVIHAYSAAGSYRVKVTGEDALGNVSSASATVAIASSAATSMGSKAISMTGGGGARSPGGELPGGTVSNPFKIVRTRVERGGRIVLTLRVFLPGRLSASARMAVARRGRLHGRIRRTLRYGGGSAGVRTPGLVRLVIRPRRAVLSGLRRHRRRRVLVAVTFVTRGGVSHTEMRAVMVALRREVVGRRPPRCHAFLFQTLGMPAL